MSRKSQNWYAKNVIRTFQRKNYLKLRNYLYRMKELDQIVGHNKRVPLFDARVLGQSRSKGGC